MAKYKHGVYTAETSTAVPINVTSDMVQVVFGTAPIHHTADPAAAVNKPILCNDMNDCREKLGYSEDFEKYTLCQSMYMNFMVYGVAPVVFINVLNPAQHKKTVSSSAHAISNGIVKIADDVIVSSLDIKQSNSAVSKEKYTVEWVDDVLVIAFDDSITGTVNIGYDRIDPTAVTAKDIAGAYSTASETRTGTELIKEIYPKFGVIPFILTAPGWSHENSVNSVLSAKTEEINGMFTAHAIVDIKPDKAAKWKVVEVKNSMPLNENSTACYGLILAEGHKIWLSAVISAMIMAQSSNTGGVICTSPSNKSITAEDIINPVDGNSIYYDTEDGNELNAQGIVTVISRNGWYVWGNNTAAYPNETDPVKRWIMTRLTYNYIENDFIHSNFGSIDQPLNKRMVEDCITAENIKLASWAAAGYIVGGSMSYNAEDNPETDILAGHFTCRTSLAANVPGEAITNVFSFDTATLTSSIVG